MSKIESISKSYVAAPDRSSVDKQGLRLRLYLALCIGDAAAILLGFLFAASLPFHAYHVLGGLNLAFTLVPIYGVFAFSNQTYSLAALRSSVVSCRGALLSLAAAVLVVVAVGYSLKAIESVSRLLLGIGIVTSAVLLVANRIGIRRYVRHIHKDALSCELVIVDGDVANVDIFGPNVVMARYVGIEPNLNDPLMLHRLGVILQNFDRAVVACTPDRWADWALLLKGANITGEIIMPSVNELRPVGVGTYGSNHTMVVARGPLALANRAKKRALDLAVTVPALIFLAPLLLLVGLAIRLDSQGPVFFKQDRIGRGNRIFKILKFRSMHDTQCDAAGGVSTGREDKRVTRVGRFIRATSIDELPQLINVLMGDMSLVGPRPHALGSLAGDKLFWEVDPHYWHRHALKPGITGLAQVRGFRGATEHHSDLQNRLNSDLEYVEGWSIWRDISILISTGMVVVHKNAF